MWLQHADVTLQQAVALSCDWNPDDAHAARLVPDLYNDRYLIAQSHARAGSLKSRNAQYTLAEFARWAKEMGWELPKEFPKPPLPPPPPNKPPPPKPAADGVAVTLPRVSRKLNALFGVIRAHWTKYDPKNPPKQTNIAGDIDKALGWEPKSDGSPSRNASALAALIRPDDVADGDRRGKKRRED